MKKANLISPKIKEKVSILNIAIFVILCVYFISLLIPILWAAYSALNDIDAYDAYYTLHNAFPTKLTFDNFITALTKLYVIAETKEQVRMKYYFVDMMGFSVLYAVGSAFFFTLTPCLVAYCAARFKFKFSKVIYGFVIVAMSLPIVGTMPSELRMLRFLGIDNTFFGMFVLRMNFLSVNFLIMYAQFQMIPMTYSEAAKVDGASNFRTMTTVIMPQAVPTMVTIFLLSFLTFWNDYQIPHIYLPSYPTVAEGLFLLSDTGQGAFNWLPVRLAGFIGLTFPIIIIFALLNKFLKVNVATGGIKG